MSIAGTPRRCAGADGTRSQSSALAVPCSARLQLRERATETAQPLPLPINNFERVPVRKPRARAWLRPRRLERDRARLRPTSEPPHPGVGSPSSRHRGRSGTRSKTGSSSPSPPRAAPNGVARRPCLRGCLGYHMASYQTPRRCFGGRRFHTRPVLYDRTADQTVLRGPRRSAWFDTVRAVQGDLGRTKARPAAMDGAATPDGHGDCTLVMRASRAPTHASIRRFEAVPSGDARIGLRCVAEVQKQRLR